MRFKNTIPMSNQSGIARKLCDEIVEPALTHPGIYNGQRSNVLRSSNIKRNENPSGTIVIEKTRVINKIVPTNTRKTTSINTFRSKDSLLRKKYVDHSVNTIVTGPLRCDNTCVTMVRRREVPHSCRCSQTRKEAKHMQTHDIRTYCLDKSCAPRVETVNCGTQFLAAIKMTSNPEIHSISRSVIRTRDSDFEPLNNKILNERSTENERSKNNVLSFMGARRWALTHYPTRGPDF